MRQKSDPRHQKRVTTVKKLFEKSFRPNLELAQSSLAGQVIKKQKEIDKLISTNAPAWPINQIAPVDLAILRLAIFELVFKKTVPFKVIIDEAVEIAKEYGGSTSSAFINGVLGAIVKSKGKS